MKIRFNPFLTALCAIAVACPLQAGILYWDGINTSTNADGGNGDWDTSLTNWDTLAAAGLDTAWPSLTTPDDDAVFGGIAGTVTVAAGGVTANSLTFNTANYVLQGGKITLNGTTPSISNAVAATINSEIGGTEAVGLTKAGAGILTLGSANTYTGTTAITAGTLQINHASALGTTAGGTTVSSGATLALSGGLAVGAEALNLSGTGVGGLGAIRSISGVNSMSGAVTLAAATQIGVDADTLELSGAISGGTLGLTAVGAGKLILSGGGTFGTMAMGNGTASLGGNLEWKAGTGTTAGTYFGVGDNVNATFTMSGGSLTVTPGTSLFVGSNASSGVTGTMNVTGGTFTMAAAKAIYVGGGGYNGTVSGDGILNVSNGTFATGTTTDIFRLGANTTGKVGNGVINLSATGVIETARSITKGLQGTATVNFDGGTYKLRAAQATMFGAGVVTNVKAGGAVIDTNTFDGTIATVLAAGSPSGGLTKMGAGTLTLNGNNSYTGGTTVTAGTLALGHAGALGTTGTVTMNGGTLRFSSTNTGDYSSRILLADGKTAVFDTNSQNVTFATAFQVGTLKTAIVNKTGTGTLTLSAAGTHTGGTSIAASTAGVSAIRISNAAALGTGTLTIGSGGNSDQSRLELTGDIAVTNTVASASSRNNFAPSILNVSGNNSLSSNIASGSGGSRLSFQSDSGKLTLSGSIGVRNPFFTGSGDFLVSGIINSPSGNLSLTKEGAGTLILSGASNATATLTTITAGVLQIGNAGTSGTLGTAPVTNNATLVFNRSDSFGVNNTISGSGALTKQGAGTVTLGGTNSHTGVTTLTAGTLSVATIGDGGVSGNLGAATNAAANIVFGGGALQYSASSATTTNRGFTINAASSATFDVSNALGELTITGAVPTTTGVLYKTGSGAMNLDPGASTLSFGAITANGGNLTLKSGTYATTAKDSTSGLSGYNVGAGARGGKLTIDGATLNVGGVGNNLKIAANASGSLDIKSGIVTSNELVIGHNGVGTGTQSGGTVTVTNLYHQDGGAGNTYTLSGGTLTAARIYNNTASTQDFTLNLNGGTLKSATGTTNLIDNQNTGAQIAVLLGAGNTIIDTTASDATIVRPMGDMPTVAGTFTKAGSNKLTLTAASTYSGGTTLSAGTLLANNSTDSATGTGAVTVNGGTLGGTGSISGAVTINTTGVLSPGASIESLATGALTLNTGSTFAYELNTAATTGDLLDVNGNLDLNGTVTLDLAHIGTVNALALGTKFTLISYFGSWTSGDIFNGYADDSDFTMFGNEWRIDYNDTSAGSVNGGAFTNAVTLTVVPEPGAALLGGLGLLALLRRRR